MKVVSKEEYDLYQEERTNNKWFRDDLRNMIDESRDAFERAANMIDARYYDQKFKEQSYNLKNAVMVGDNVSK